MKIFVFMLSTSCLLLLVNTKAYSIEHGQRKPPISIRNAVKRNSGKIRYDLGIGKNVPVSQASFHIPSPTFVDATGATTRYLVEHESVRPYPSPKLPKKEKKSFPAVLPNRVTDETVLRIYDKNSAIGAMNSHFDLNTPWIELLIHEQQQKLATAR